MVSPSDFRPFSVQIVFAPTAAYPTDYNSLTGFRKVLYRTLVNHGNIPACQEPQERRYRDLLLDPTEPRMCAPDGVVTLPRWCIMAINPVARLRESKTFSLRPRSEF